MNLQEQIFGNHNEDDFKKIALQVFKFQYENNPLYQEFCQHLSKNSENVLSLEQIPFLPIQFFKTHSIKTTVFKEQQVFLSSGTTGANQSKHFVKDVSLYKQSFIKSFEYFYGKSENFVWLALLPSYMEREGSSLIYMAEYFVAKNSESGFYLNDYEALINKLVELKKFQKKVVLLGVSFALLDLAEQFELDLSDVVVMETGGMKGRRKELTREELHAIYKQKLNISEVHSEYGMTELLSQAYSKGKGEFQTPPWMKVLIREVDNPLNYLENNRTGGVNVIDFANLYSCSFIATQDLGKSDGNSFEILGRFDNSDLRGCNLLIQ